MPRTPDKNDAIRKKRMEQIIQSGMQVYLEKGIHRMEMGDVAENAGVGRGTVYHYFDNKYDLLQEVFIRIMEDGKAIVDDTLMIGAKPIDRLELFFKRQAIITAKNPFLFRFYKNIFEDVALVFGDKSNKIFNNFQSNLYEPVIDTIREAIDMEQVISIEPTRLSQILWGALVGAVTTYVNTDVTNDNSIIEDIIEILFNGIKAKP
ncbi:TetR/AcrR family transcriptional regulator [Candidatus Formimonas warabiya]|uniref:HTH tetR-type domain-containing protein n=1 Tax=Formimonas warabiya TaxID=1761012 RepID=A0A3G1KM42_FORW1|nr:TetR/AcrR family transcriptional regulator [Candidatus Formimonas warabiya]ATW23500.1 hypothetical protein DCMF_00650 [Candidatus Formimonas warabiya]